MPVLSKERDVQQRKIRQSRPDQRLYPEPGPLAMLNAQIYWHLPILLILVSLVYSAVRSDDWRTIWLSTWRWALYMLLMFMLPVFLILWFFSEIAPHWW